MKILIVNEKKETQEKITHFVPRVGDNIYMFYDEVPLVHKVILWPSLAALGEYGVNARPNEFEAIAFVKHKPMIDSNP